MTEYDDVRTVAVIDKDKETVFTTNGHDYNILLVINGGGCCWGGGGGTQAMFVNLSTRDMFASVNVIFISLMSHSYMTGVTTAVLWWHLSYMNGIIYT